MSSRSCATFQASTSPTSAPTGMRPPAARPVLAFLTDFGTRDPYVGAMKGAALSVCADATIVVADPRQTDRIQLREAVAWLRRANATVLGIVASPSRKGPTGPTGPRQAGGPTP